MQILSPRNVLTPAAFEMLNTIATTGSFAAAARELGLVPSALTYRVRQLEEALDVLLFDRSSRQARPTRAGDELLREGERLLRDIDAVAHRVRRVATGWEPYFTVAADGIVATSALMELVDAFLAQDPPTHLKIRSEVLSGTLDALAGGQADLSIGVASPIGTLPDLQVRPLVPLEFVLVMAPHHALARQAEPLSDAQLRAHRAVAVADSVQRGGGVTVGLLPGQDVLTVPTLAAKLDVQLRGLGIGFLPEPMVRAYVDAGLLVKRRTRQPDRLVTPHYAWRGSASGRALQWWLAQLERPATRRALLELHPGTAAPAASP